MAILKCKMCGGDLAITAESVCVCEYCGSKQTVPSVDDEKKIKLYQRANKLRFGCEFDKAYYIYESIVDDFPNEAEAYWGLVLCKYGIEYVDDISKAKKVPTCHRPSFDSVMDDENFELALENADVVARTVYREEAKQIEEIRKSIITLSAKEEPYDIFICYKETDEKGERTVDSVIAQDVYKALIGQGYKVFFARTTLEDKLGKEYEPIIFSALNSAKVMLVFGTNYEYFNAVWVKNEWSRYLKLMEKNSEKILIPCYKDIDAYDIPKELAHLQAQNMGKVGAVQDLLRGIEKIVSYKNQKIASGEIIDIKNLLTRANLYLLDKDYEKAKEYFEKVLDNDAHCSEAYLGLDLAEHKVANHIDLAKHYAVNHKKFTANIKHAKDFGKNASWINEFDNIYNSEEWIVFEIKNGSTLIKYRGTEKNVVIPNYITEIEKEAFRNCNSLESVVIPSSVTSIGDYAFKDCNFLRSVVIPSSVTSIGSEAFYCYKNFSIKLYCEVKNAPSTWNPKWNKGVKSVTWDHNEHGTTEDGFEWLITNSYPDSVLIVAYNGKNTKICIPSVINNKAVTEIGNYAFGSLKCLTSVTVPNSIVRIGKGAFSNCSSLATIVLPNSIDSINDNMFYDCSALKSIEIPNSVTSIGNDAFNGCSSLTRAEIPDGVTSIGIRLFWECKALKSIKIPSSVTSVADNCFYGCSLEEATIPTSVISPFFETEKLERLTINGGESIKHSAFYHCTALTSVVLSNGITSIGDSAFRGCTSLTHIEIPDSVTAIGHSAFCDCTALKGLVIPSSVTSIGNNAYWGCSALESVVMPNSVTSIGRSCFYQCPIKEANVPTVAISFLPKEKLKLVTINDGTSIAESAFKGCTSLESVIIPDSVTSIGECAFEKCVSLKSIEIPKGVTKIERSTFSACRSLKSVAISHSVTSIGECAFKGCSSFKSIEIPNSVTSIGNGAFEDCYSLASVEIPKSVVSVGSHIFDSCHIVTATVPTNMILVLPTWNLEKLIINGGASIDDNALNDCQSLKSVVISNSVTSIGNGAFKNCRSLASVEIPSSVTDIGVGAFLGCKISNERMQNRLCIYCGGIFKGLLTKNCTSCGRKKSY